MEIERFGAADRGWARDALALACRLHAAHRRQREPYARPGRLHDRSRPGHGRAARAISPKSARRTSRAELPGCDLAPVTVVTSWAERWNL